MADEPIVAIGLLTERHLRLLGPTLAHVWPVDEAPCFTGLLEAIDEADRRVWGKRDEDDGAGV